MNMRVRNFDNSRKSFPMSIPEGYLDSLQERLCTIPNGAEQNAGPFQRLVPYFALAACFLAILLVGNFVLNTTSERMTGDYMNEAFYADLMELPDEAFHSLMYEQDTISYSDVIDYLIESGASSEIIEYTNLIAKK